MNRFFLSFFPIFAIFLALSLPKGLYGEKKQGSICNYSLPLPPGSLLIKEERDLLLFRSQHQDQHQGQHRGQHRDSRRGDTIAVEWIFNCRENQFKTDRIGELRKEAKRRQENISSIEELRLPRHDIRVALFLRSRGEGGERRSNAEAWFSTREVEYRLYGFPYIPDDIPDLGRGKDRLDSSKDRKEKGAALRKDTVSEQIAIKVVQREMMLLLQGGNFIRPPQKAITEAAYLQRLYFIVGITGVAIALPLLAVLLRIGNSLFRKPTERSARKPAGRKVCQKLRKD